MDILTRFKNLTSINEPILDGAIHRFGKKDSGWYVGHVWDHNGKSFSIIRVGSWNGSIPESTLKSWDYNDENKGFKKKFADISREAEAKLKVETHAKNQECKQKWGPIFDKCENVKSHEYLKHKSVDSFIGRVDFNGVLLIPAYNVNGFTGVQRIFKDPETDKFVKKFSFGIEIKGSICPLKPFKKADYCYLSEGFATAASVQMAFPDIPSICAFNAGNLLAAIETIRTINPKIKIVIAADRDQSKVGENYAKKCINSYPDVIYRLPELENKEWTDFNDLHNYVSLESVQNQLAFDDSDFCTVTELGYNGNTFFYTSSTFKQIMALNPSSHNKVNFFALAPIKYWAKKYGAIDEESGKPIVSYDYVSSLLMEKCREIGIFDPDNVRGTGVWIDGNDYVINDGEKITPKKKTSYHYQISKQVNFNMDDELSDEQCQKIVASISNLYFKNKKDSIFLTAFIAQAQIFSVLPWRFHVWLSGSKGTGKSKILDWLSGMIINPNKIQATTVAGIVQALKNDARVTIYDEAEAAESDRMAPILELARQMSTLGEFKIMRGSSSGKVVQNNTNTNFVFGSIQVPMLNDADRSRFFVIEMDQIKGQSQETYDTLCENFETIAKYKNLLFARCYNNVSTIVKNYRSISNLLRKQGLEPRLADQFGTALACYAIMHNTKILDIDEIKSLIEFADIKNTDYVEQNKTVDHQDCLSEIFDVVVDKDGLTIGAIIGKIDSLSGDGNLFDQMLSSYGMKYYRSERNLFLSVNSKLKKAIGSYPDYLRTLRRSKNLIETRAFVKINNILKAGIKLKIEKV